MSESSNEEKGSWPLVDLPRGWEWVPFCDFFYDKTDSRKKLPQKEYSPEGSVAVVDQGEELVGGYTDKVHLISDVKLPAIVWGDHTRVVKFITFPFVQGADGVKVFQLADIVEPKFGYYTLLAVDIPNKGYSRHFKFLKKTSFPLPPLNEQRRIVCKLDSLLDRSRHAREELAIVASLMNTSKENKLLDRLNKAILAKAICGKLVPQDPNDEPVSALLARLKTSSSEVPKPRRGRRPKGTYEDA